MPVNAKHAIYVRNSITVPVALPASSTACILPLSICIPKNLIYVTMETGISFKEITHWASYTPRRTIYLVYGKLSLITLIEEHFNVYNVHSTLELVS